MAATAVLSAAVETLAEDFRGNRVGPAAETPRVGLELNKYGALSTAEPSQVDVEIRVDGEKAAITTRWSGSASHPYFRAALARPDASALEVRAAIAFAAVSPWRDQVAMHVGLALDDEASVTTREVTTLATAPEWSVFVWLDPVASEANVRLRRVTLVLAGDGLEFGVVRDKDQAFVDPPPPDRIAGNRATWNESLLLEGATAPRAVEVTVIPRAAPMRTGEPPTSGRALAAWASMRHPTWLGDLVFPMLATLPFLLAVLWLPRPADERRRRQFVALLALFGISTVLFAGWDLLGHLNGPLRAIPTEALRGEGGLNLERMIARIEERGLFDFTGLLSLTLAVNAVGWWLGGRYARGAGVPSADVRHASFLAVTAVSALGLGWLTLEVDRQRGVVAAGAALILAAAAGCVAGRFAPGSGPLAGAIVAALAIAVSATSPFGLRQEAIDTAVNVAIGAVLGAVVLAAFLGALCGVLTGKSPGKWVQEFPWAPAAVVGAAAVISILFWPHHGDVPAISSLLDIFSAMLRLREWLLYALALILLAELRRLSRLTPAEGWTLDHAWRVVAVLLLVVAFEPARTLWFLPMVAGLGLVGFRLAVPPLDSRVTPPFPSVDQRLASLAPLVRLRELERAERRGRPRRVEKLATGELTAKDAAAAAAAIEAERRRASGLGTTALDELDFHVSGYGPGDSAWHSGCLGAGYSGLIGLPWVLLYWREALLEPMSARFAVDVVLSMIGVTLTWLSYGFVLGYFFPHIRGRRATTKAIVLAPVFAVPLVAFGVAVLVPLGAQTWSSLVVLAVQIVSHFLILAVLFDLHLVRRAGLPGGVLLELRELRPVVSWAGAILVALGGVVTSVLVASFTTVVSAGLSYVTEGPARADPQPPVVTSPPTTVAPPSQ